MPSPHRGRGGGIRDNDTDNGPLFCPLCSHPKLLSQHHFLYRHLETHSIASHHCPPCNKEIAGRQECAQHMRQYHKDSIKPISVINKRDRTSAILYSETDPIHFRIKRGTKGDLEQVQYNERWKRWEPVPGGMTHVFPYPTHSTTRTALRCPLFSSEMLTSGSLAETEEARFLDNSFQQPWLVEPDQRYVGNDTFSRLFDRAGETNALVALPTASYTVTFPINEAQTFSLQLKQIEGFLNASIPTQANAHAAALCGSLMTDSPVPGDSVYSNTVVSTPYYQHIEAPPCYPSSHHEPQPLFNPISINDPLSQFRLAFQRGAPGPSYRAN